jgi:hypothetical protein
MTVVDELADDADAFGFPWQGSCCRRSAGREVDSAPPSFNSLLP